MSAHPTAVTRLALTVAIPLELALAVCLLAGIRVPGAVLTAAEALILCVLALELFVLGRLYAGGRRSGLPRREAVRAALREAVPPLARRLLAHELRSLYSLARWLLRCGPQLPHGAASFGYTSPQTAMLYGLVFVAVLETVLFALVIPWPLVHAILLVVDVYGVVLLLALHAACVLRPHVVAADGALRLRYGALFDLRVPAASIASARVDRRYPDGGLLRLSEDGVLDLAVGSQTTVTLELTEALPFTRPLGATGTARVLRFHTDDPRGAVAALRGAASTPGG